MVLQRMRVSSELIEAAMTSVATRARLAQVADRMASRAESLASAEGVRMEVSREDGTRPKGRPYSRVVSDNPGQEWGTSKTGRARIMGRAAEGR